MKQYLPMKPHKWGFKLFVLCGTDGFAYKFEIYSGQENKESAKEANEPDLGTCGNVVVKLCCIVPRNENYRIYFDNYYTTLKLLTYLAHEGIYSLGTVRRNRIPNCKLPTDKDMKKEDRGKSFELVGTLNNIEINSTVWKDNKLVTLSSTFCRQQPETTIKRYDKSEKATVNIKCPAIIMEYNQHMGSSRRKYLVIQKNNEGKELG